MKAEEAEAAFSLLVHEKLHRSLLPMDQANRLPHGDFGLATIGNDDEREGRFEAVLLVMKEDGPGFLGKVFDIPPEVEFESLDRMSRYLADSFKEFDVRGNDDPHRDGPWNISHADLEGRAESEPQPA